MGIKGLSKLIADEAPGAIKEGKLENFFGRKIAIDASMAIYQFLIAVRSAADQGGVLTNEAGEVTSHLQGFLHRTARMLEAGIKPVYVFDGKPPELKLNELKSRKAKREQAEEKAKEAREVAVSKEDVEKFEKRTVRVSQQHNDECKRLLRLMGVPFVEAPSEAEAQCAELSRAGVVYAAGSEDMDTITLGAPVLVRHLTFAEARKQPVLEIKSDEVVQGLGLTREQFIDLCILCGCDYCGTIRGIGPKKALALIRSHGCLEEVIKNLDTEKYPLPDPFPYEAIRQWFLHPDVTNGSELAEDIKWGEPDEEGIVKFLVEEKSFNSDRVRGVVQRLRKARAKGTQVRLDSFFKPSGAAAPAAAKRKGAAKGADKGAKKAKKGGFFRK